MSKGKVIRHYFAPDQKNVVMAHQQRADFPRKSQRGATTRPGPSVPLIGPSGITLNQPKVLALASITLFSDFKMNLPFSEHKLPCILLLS